MSDKQQPGSVDDHTTVEELINALRAEGIQDSHGAFTLDRDLARLKMRRFQLKNPANYVLSLVHAAVLKNATRIDFRLDDDDLYMTFDGRPFTLRELEELYAALFTRDLGPDVEALRELTIAINAAGALDTKYFRLRSGDGAKGVWYDVEDGEEEAFDADKKPLQGTHIHVKTRFKGRIARAFAFSDKEHPLLRAIRVCCQFSWLRITVNGKQVSCGLELSRAVGAVRFETANLRGVAGFLPDAKRPGEVLLCKYGVWFSTVLHPDSRPGFAAVVEGYRLRKDISQTHAVNDAALAEVYQAVQEVSERAMDQLCREVAEKQSDGSLPDLWSRNLLRSELMKHSTAAALFGDGVGERTRNLTRVRLWATFASTHGAARLQSLKELKQFREKKGTLAVVVDDNVQAPMGQARLDTIVGDSRILVVVVPQRADRDFLRAVLADAPQTR